MLSEQEEGEKRQGIVSKWLIFVSCLYVKMFIYFVRVVFWRSNLRSKLALLTNGIFGISPRITWPDLIFFEGVEPLGLVAFRAAIS